MRADVYQRGGGGYNSWPRTSRTTSSGGEWQLPAGAPPGGAVVAVAERKGVPFDQVTGYRLDRIRDVPSLKRAVARRTLTRVPRNQEVTRQLKAWRRRLEWVLKVGGAAIPVGASACIQLPAQPEGPRHGGRPHNLTEIPIRITL